MSGRRGGRLLCVLVGGALLAGCGSSSSGSGVDPVKPLALTGGHAVIGKLSITGAYIPDPATPSLAAAYFTVTNAGSADTLRSIDIAAFRSAMLNRYVTASDGAESMVAVNGGVTIPAHGRLVLHPGSYHVMLQHPIHPIKQGMTTRLTLTFAHAGRVSMVVPVVADTGLPAGGSGSDDNSMPGDEDVRKRRMRLANAVRRALAICCIAAGALLGSALPASAHTLGPGVAAMNYRTRLLSVSPQISGVRFQVVDDGLHVIATNSGATPLVIDGYAGEPYLRVDRSGSWENLRSPATYLDQSFTPGAVPAIADAKAAPVWHRLGTVDWVRWHDHRLHWMGPQPPVQVQAHPGAFNLISVWQLNAKYGAREIRVTGTLAWVPGSSPVGWILVLALSLALAVVVGWKWRHGPGPRIVLGGLILADLARSVGLVEGRGGSLGDRLQALPWRGVPELLLTLIVVGAIALGGRRRILAAYVCVFAGLAVLLLDGAVSLSALWRSQVIAWHPWWLERALIAGTVGGALGAAAVGALLLARQPTPTSPTPPSSRPRLRAVAAAGALFTVAGCSGGGSHSAQPVAVDTAHLPRIGSVLTDAGGHVLYLFVPDHRRAVSCSEVCQGSWPPLVVPAGASVTAMGAARQRLLGEVRNPVGGPAVATYNGWPLYTYVGDVAPGTANGQALNLNGGLWYLLAPDGAVVKKPVTA